MKNKKIWARIGAILACVLLVGAFAIPCFADDYFDADPLIAYNEFYNKRVTSSMRTQSYYDFIDHYKSFTATDALAFDMFFMQSVFASGPVLLSGKQQSRIIIGNDDEVSLVEGINYTIVVNGNSYSEYGVMAELILCRLFVFYFGKSEVVGVILDDGSLSVSWVGVNGVRYNVGDIDSISLSIGSNSVSGKEDVGLVGVVSAILFPEPLVNHIVYPQYYYYGFSDGFFGDSNSFQEGYDAAVRDIESGDFGRNFLAGVFSAPLDAMNQFTLVRWETASGDLISINLLSILSAIVGLTLFIWFLKMFAGG